MISIRLQGIEKSYGTTPVLQGIDLEIESGELFFLLGPSGCGKSTLLRIIAGFLPATGGRVFFGDDDVTRLAPERRDAGMVFQSYALWPHMTVFQNVAFGLEIRKLGKAEIERQVMETLGFVGLEKLRDRPIPQLSGGQQQRVALARALVIQPRVLLLDEPLSNLDAKLRLDMRAEIRRICKEAGLTTLYVTHDQKEALSMADRLAVLDNGILQQVGAPRDVYRRPINAFVADFIGESNFVTGRISRREGAAAEIESPWGILHSTTVADSLAPGDPCLVCIRPESIRFAANGESLPNTLTMTLRHATYLGEIGQWGLEIHGQHLKAFEMQPPTRTVDQEYRCSIAPADAIVIPADTTTAAASQSTS